MKGSSTCRICGRWMEGDYVDDPERADRETRQGHCDTCTPVVQGRPQEEIDADTKAMRAEQEMQRQVEQKGRGIGPLLFLDWESPLDPNWARRFGIQLDGAGLDLPTTQE